MKTTDKLQQLVTQAVRNSMRIEGYTASKLSSVQAKAKAMMESQRVQVSVRGK